jgi:hypothetical protein
MLGSGFLNLPARERQRDRIKQGDEQKHKIISDVVIGSVKFSLPAGHSPSEFTIAIRKLLQMRKF